MKGSSAFSSVPYITPLTTQSHREADFELESKKKEIRRELKWADMLATWESKKWKGKVRD